MTSNKTVEKSIAINAAASRIWKALTDPQLLNAWMSEAEIEVITDWKTGSPILVRGQVNGPYEYKGIILEFEPERSLRYSSWNRISKLPDRPENYALIDFRLTAVDNHKTILQLTHSNLIAEKAFEHANFYWSSALAVMKRVVETHTTDIN